MITGTTRLDVAEVEGWMLWPDDEAERARSLEACRVHFLASTVIAQPPALATLLLDDAAKALPVSFYRQSPDTLRRFLYGVVAGHVVDEILNSLHFQERTTVEEELKRMADCFGRKRDSGGNYRGPLDRWIPKLKGIGWKTLEKEAWPVFKPVAHYWAAFLQRCGSGADQCFPCSAKSLPVFLAFAEHYRQLGAKASPWRSSQDALLPESISICIPTEIVLPHIEVETTLKSERPRSN